MVGEMDPFGHFFSYLKPTEKSVFFCCFIESISRLWSFYLFITIIKNGIFYMDFLSLGWLVGVRYKRNSSLNIAYTTHHICLSVHLSMSVCMYLERGIRGRGSGVRMVSGVYGP